MEGGGKGGGPVVFDYRGSDGVRWWKMEATKLGWDLWIMDSIASGTALFFGFECSIVLRSVDSTSKIRRFHPLIPITHPIFPKSRR